MPSPEDRHKFIRDDSKSVHKEGTVIAKGPSREVLRNWLFDHYHKNTVYVIERTEEYA